jgi:hypothetical protein
MHLWLKVIDKDTSFLMASNNSKLKFACASKFRRLMLTTRPLVVHAAFHVEPWADLPSSQIVSYPAADRGQSERCGILDAFLNQNTKYYSWTKASAI